MEDTSKGEEVQLVNNGVWTNNTLAIPNLIAQYMKVWLEDSVPEDLLQGVKDSKGQYTVENQKSKIKDVYELLVQNRKVELEDLLKADVEQEKA